MKILGIILFYITLLALVVGALIYLSNRFTLFFPSIPKKAWLSIFISSFVVILAGMLLFSMTANPIGRVVYIVGGTISAVLIFLLLSVAAIDLFNLIFKFSPQTRGILSVGIASLLTIYGIWNAYTIKVKEVIIPVKGLTQEVKAVHLTDIHLGNFRGKKEIDKIVRKINELNPDVVFNTGDLFESKIHFNDSNDVLSAFSTLKAPHYFVYGNHDQYVGHEEVVNRMREVGVTVLQNEIDYHRELQIVGLNNMIPDLETFDPHATANSGTIEDVLNNLDVKEDLPTIILHHRPDGVKYMQAKGADLLLAGHTHAGQIFPLSIIAKLMFGYNSGLYQYETMNIYVSEGIGAIFAPVRLGTSSEMTLIRMIPHE